MLVTVRRFFSEDCWYSEMIGETFTAYTKQNSPFLYFNELMFFFPQDVDSIQPNKKVNIPFFENQVNA